MKKIIYCILLLSFINANCQNKISNEFNIKAGIPYPAINSTGYFYYNIDDKIVVAIKNQKDEITIQKINKATIKEIERKTYTDFPSGYQFESIVETNNKLYFIYHLQNKKNDNVDVFAREISKETCFFTQTKLLFTTSKGVNKISLDITESSPNGLIPGTTFGNSNYHFKIVTSSDKSKVFINYTLHPINKIKADNTDIKGFVVLDNEMNVLSKNEVLMPYMEDKIRYNKSIISNNGDMFLLVCHDNLNKSELFNISSKGKITTIPINFEDKTTNTIGILEEKTNGIVFFGFYSSLFKDVTNNFFWDDVNFYSKGIYTFLLSDNLTIENLKTIQFPEDYIFKFQKPESVASIKKYKLGDDGLIGLTLHSIKKLSDGNFLIIGEEKSIMIQKSSSGTFISSHFYNLTVLKLNKSLDTVWVNKIPKCQSSNNGLGSLSFKVFNLNQTHYLFFFDNPINKNITKNQEPVAYWNKNSGVLKVCKIDTDSGEIIIDELFNTTKVLNKQIYEFGANRIFQISDTEILLDAYLKDKNDSFYKISLK